MVFSGLLAFAFGIAVVYFPANIMFGRITDVIFGEAKPLSGGMTAVAALLALVVLVAGDGLTNLFAEGLINKNVARIRSTAGIAVAIAAFVAVELIGLWAVLVGILELAFVRDSANDRALQIIAAVALRGGSLLVRWWSARSWAWQPQRAESA